MAVLAEVFRPDIGCIELGWNVVDANLALLYCLPNTEGPQSHVFRTRAVGLVAGHVQSRGVVDVDSDSLQRFFESQLPTMPA